VSEVSTEVIRREMAVKPTIQIAAGTLFNVVLTRDLHFPAP
jgi:type IV secretory pathway VirB10-like protein